MFAYRHKNPNMIYYKNVFFWRLMCDVRQSTGTCAKKFQIRTSKHSRNKTKVNSDCYMNLLDDGIFLNAHVSMRKMIYLLTGCQRSRAMNVNVGKSLDTSKRDSELFVNRMEIITNICLNRIDE